MIRNHKKFYIGFGLLVSFVILIIIIFLPVFNGANGLEYMDSLYNSISKGSAYYIPELTEEAVAFKENRIRVNIRMENETRAEQTALLFGKGGADVRLTGEQLAVEGGLGRILENCLEDSEIMYHNAGQKIESKYQLGGRQVLFNWYRALKAMEKELKSQGKFKEADVVAFILEKGVETSYNYYGIEPRNISDSVGVVIFSLVFYVIYTVWYGFAFMYMFEGWGMRLSH